MLKSEFISTVFKEQKLYEKYSHVTDIDALCKIISKDKYSLQRELNCSHYKVAKIISTIWPEREPSNERICTYLMHSSGVKYCRYCQQVKSFNLFSKNSSTKSGYNSHCKMCYTVSTREYQREYQYRRKLLEYSRIPSWADLSKIKEIYSNCPDGYHVDHIVPLQGKLVCGLHVESNLQYLPAVENLSKHNKFNDWDVN